MPFCLLNGRNFKNCLYAIHNYDAMGNMQSTLRLLQDSTSPGAYTAAGGTTGITILVLSMLFWCLRKYYCRSRCSRVPIPATPTAAALMPVLSSPPATSPAPAAAELELAAEPGPPEPDGGNAAKQNMSNTGKPDLQQLTHASQLHPEVLHRVVFVHFVLTIQHTQRTHPPQHLVRLRLRHGSYVRSARRLEDPNDEVRYQIRRLSALDSIQRMIMSGLRTRTPKTTDAHIVRRRIVA